MNEVSVSPITDDTTKRNYTFCLSVTNLFVLLERLKNPKLVFCKLLAFLKYVSTLERLTMR